MKIPRIVAAIALTTSLALGGAALPATAATGEERAALGQARDYVRLMNFSKAKLYDQLHGPYGKFSAKASRYGVNHVKANWSKEALGAARDYRKLLHLSTAAIHDQLVGPYEKYTEAQADYAVAHLG